MGLYYLKTRYYDPEVGRFINMDGISYADPETINGLNLYAYCLNNPVNYSDSSGMFATAIFAGLALLSTFLFAGYIETTYHPIGNALEEIGNNVGDWVESVESDISNNVDLPSNKPNISIEQNSQLPDKIIIPGIVKTSEIFYVVIENIVFEAEHTKNKRPSSKETHERGLARKRRDKAGGEKGDARRKFRRNGKHLKFEIYENIINLFL